LLKGVIPPMDYDVMKAAYFDFSDGITF